jgi:predicted ATPase
VVVVDDLHWGEETFLDLIEHIALLSSCAPLLLICLARLELLDRRPDWPIALRLEPLAGTDVARLIPPDVPEGLHMRIARASGGNPLFIEEMVAMTGEAAGEVVVPPSLQSLLAARLDQLESGERTVLDCGAVEGAIFHSGAVQALAPADTQVTPHVAGLVRKELIRPTSPQIAGEDGFRFRHLLIRDAAYDTLPKATRADLHERFAAWLQERGTNLVELDEILGYHLEQACRYRAEVGMPDDGALAAAARRRLAAAGGRALGRSDNFAAANLLQRAAALMPPAELDVALEHDLVFAPFWAGKSGQALERARSIAERSSLAADRVGELCGRILEGRLNYELGRISARFFGTTPVTELLA